MSDEQQPPQDDPHTACSEQLAACEARAAELEAKWKRALADRANEEKANARAREEFAKYAAASVLRDLLPIVDAVDAASVVGAGPRPRPRECREVLDVPATANAEGSRDDEQSQLLGSARVETGEAMSSPRDRRTPAPPLREDDGLTAIATLLHDLLTHHGVVRIPCEGKPDYTLHEIISTRAVEGAEPGVIVEIVQQGYTMHGQCLRPARVIVSA